MSCHAFVKSLGFGDGVPKDAVRATEFPGGRVWLASRQAAKHFGSSGGSIVKVSSVVGISPLATASVYSATKAAVDAVTKSLAKELGPRKIRVNSINPGMVETEGTHGAGITEGDFRKSIEQQTPLGRIGQPDDIAPVAVFFASSDSAWITGETSTISGGLV